VSSTELKREAGIWKAHKIQFWLFCKFLKALVTPVMITTTYKHKKPLHSKLI